MTIWKFPVSKVDINDDEAVTVTLSAAIQDFKYWIYTRSDPTNATPWVLVGAGYGNHSQTIGHAPALLHDEILIEIRPVAAEILTGYAIVTTLAAIEADGTWKVLGQWPIPPQSDAQGKFVIQVAFT